jgi:hypothetical protein
VAGSAPDARGAPGRLAARLWLVADAVLFLLFAFSVVVQVNDPDPVPWMALYGAAALACLAAMRRRGPWWYPASVALAAVVWAATIAPRVVGKVPFGDMFGAFEMKDLGVEESREMYGLLLVAAYLAVIAVRAARRPRPRA